MPLFFFMMFMKQKTFLAITFVFYPNFMIEIKVPSVGESINEVSLAAWKIKNGDYVKRDQVICELESEKATFELNAEQAGTVHFVAEEGADLQIGDIVCTIDESAKMPENISATEPEKIEKVEDKVKNATEAIKENVAVANKSASPVAEKIIEEKKIATDKITGTGPLGKIMKSDVLHFLSAGANENNAPLDRTQRLEKMSKLRRTLSKRLVEAKNTTAMLTTFNEVDMSEILNYRKNYKEKFAEKHGIGLGFMSFFTRACAIALQEWPAVNAYIDGEEIRYHDYVDISIAVSAPKGLVVPVIRNAESLSMAGIEQVVKELATKARNNALTLEEMQGGTFTITNGGVFGSLLSTPIINLPQSAILGMHKIEERPIALNGQVLIRPMMYLALSYDHRIIDGRESVGFLVRVKELLEQPLKMINGKNIDDILLDL